MKFFVSVVFISRKGKYPKGKLLKPFNPMGIYGIINEHTYNISKAKKVLGYVPVYTKEEGEHLTAKFVKSTLKIH